MFDIERVINTPPFSLPREQKRRFLVNSLSQLIEHHYHSCEPYKKILNAFSYNLELEHNLESLPFLPVRLFKMMDLISVNQNEIFKTMTSSGTTGQKRSRIFLDRTTASNQSKVLTKIVTSFIGQKRLPMLVIDSPALIRDRAQFSARAAGILGFSFFGKDITYALTEDMEVNFPAIDAFLTRHAGEDLLLYGFTSILWEFFYLPLFQSGRSLSLKGAKLVHGGGWKKLADLSITNEIFKKSLFDRFGISKVYNYYGMVEQTGSIFMECELGHLHSSIFSDVLMRNADFSVCEKNSSGLVELFSILPTSYPGHILLSEDLGEILGEDDCPCGRLGTYFTVKGRIQKAEIRGCSDTFART